MLDTVVLLAGHVKPDVVAQRDALRIGVDQADAYLVGFGRQQTESAANIGSGETKRVPGTGRVGRGVIRGHHVPGKFERATVACAGIRSQFQAITAGIAKFQLDRLDAGKVRWRRGRPVVYATGRAGRHHLRPAGVTGLAVVNGNRVAVVGDTLHVGAPFAEAGNGVDHAGIADEGQDVIDDDIGGGNVAGIGDDHAVIHIAAGDGKAVLVPDTAVAGAHDEFFRFHFKEGADINGVARRLAALFCCIAIAVHVLPVGVAEIAVAAGAEERILGGTVPQDNGAVVQRLRGRTPFDAGLEADD